jgi:hypothetical protein
MTMFRATVTVTAIAVLFAAATNAQPLVISRAGSRPVRSAPAQNFAGNAQVEMLFEAVDPSHAGAGSVTFAPGALQVHRWAALALLALCNRRWRPGWRRSRAT